MLNKVTLKSGYQGNINYKSSNPFEFFHILNDSKIEDQDMFGTLFFPQEKKDTYPLVICIHGSLGWRGHHQEHMVNFLKSGMAVFRVHSFEARQVNSIVEDQMQVTLASMISDCFSALKLIHTHPDIDNKNISIAGWSLGGSTALYSAWKPIAEKLAPQGERFSSHLAFYPGAYVWPEDMRWSNAPILSLIGEIDDYTPPILIEKLSASINESAGNSEVIYYPDSHHSFDSIEPVTYLENAIGCGLRHSYLDKKGNLYFKNDEGKKYYLNEPHQRAALFKNSKNTRGASLGRNWVSREKSMKDAVNFLLKNIN